MKERTFIRVFILTALAGGLNLYGLMVLSTSLSHYTGTLTKIVWQGLEGALPFLALALIGAFFLGSVLGGLIQGKDRDKSLGLAFTIIGLLCLAANFFQPIEGPLLALGLGLQNSLALTYRGQLLRTSHITGDLTQAGFYLGRFLKGQKEDLKKGLFYLVFVLTFGLGGLIFFYLEKILQPMLIYFSLAYLALGLRECLRKPACLQAKGEDHVRN